MDPSPSENGSTSLLRCSDLLRRAFPGGPPAFETDDAGVEYLTAVLEQYHSICAGASALRTVLRNRTSAASIEQQLIHEELEQIRPHFETTLPDEVLRAASELAVFGSLLASATAGTSVHPHWPYGAAVIGTLVCAELEQQSAVSRLAELKERSQDLEKAAETCKDEVAALNTRETSILPDILASEHTYLSTAAQQQRVAEQYILEAAAIRTRLLCPEAFDSHLFAKAMTELAESHRSVEAFLSSETYLLLKSVPRLPPSRLAEALAKLREDVHSLATEVAMIVGRR
ncbi:hypothetical protein GMRT_13534 [Giardia muris]|uniref:Uncharacterized protein n=1 Tax=Giardia muris TaxID=5742 RepID=A0A4Z1SW10_GIAMU|nr:hypothetical protein GMRT_13534 [Giardia muris]|eukprot:TNJ29954.1 hypothetical protein GMRT_13534 [Giardia muris]